MPDTIATPERPTPVLDKNWRERERQRSYGRSLPVWCGEQWWYNNYYKVEDHFLHVCPDDPSKVMYTQSPEKGERDIQTRIKAGRYLTKYFGEVLSPKQIKFYATWQTQGTRPVADTYDKFTVSFATTANDIVAQYVNNNHCHSCMDGEHFEARRSPVRVYGAGDLAIAYMHKEGETESWARCLVWPARKVAGRVYPTTDYWQHDGFESADDSYNCNRALFAKLKALGFTFLEEDDSSKNFNGAKLSKIEHPHGGWYMPYLDNGYCVNDHGDHWVMARNGDHRCDDTSGVLCREEDEEPDIFCNCEHCGDAIEYYGDAYRVCTSIRNNIGQPWYERDWCYSCYEHHSFYCEGSGQQVSDDVDHVEIDCCNYCVAWLRTHGGYQSDYSGNWFLEAHDPAYVTGDGDTWSTSEYEQHGKDVVSMTVHDGRQIEAPLPPPMPHGSYVSQWSLSEFDARLDPPVLTAGGCIIATSEVAGIRDLVRNTGRYHRWLPADETTELEAA